MTNTFDEVKFKCGKSMKNRLMLAPLTNLQSHPDGTLSDEEFHWLTMRAKGGFGSTMTAAAHVQAIGQGFPGQLGIFSDAHIPGLTKLASAINEHGSVSIVQLHHAGMRSEKSVVTHPVSCSDDAETGARALSTEEVEQLTEDFITGAERAQKAGFDGVELHGAHNYIICQFLSAEYNHRDDRYGGSLENRWRLLFDIVRGIRSRCGPEFLLGVRLTPERNGIILDEAVRTAQALFDDGSIDFLDMSLWNVFKEPYEEKYQGRPLMSYFTELKRGDIKLGVAGKVYSAADVDHCLENGVDFVLLGRAGILHHDFPVLMDADRSFRMADTPVTREHLRNEGLSDVFIDYMGNWKGFVG